MSDKFLALTALDLTKDTLGKGIPADWTGIAFTTVESAPQLEVWVMGAKIATLTENTVEFQNIDLELDGTSVTPGAGVLSMADLSDVSDANLDVDFKVTSNALDGSTAQIEIGTSNIPIASIKAINSDFSEIGSVVTYIDNGDGLSKVQINGTVITVNGVVFDLSAVLQSISDNETLLNSLQSDLGTIQGDISTLQSDVSSVQGSLSSLQNLPLYNIFGSGVDGNVTISAGTTTLTRDMYYNNLTITGTGVLNPAGYRIFIKGTLDISNVSAGGGISRTVPNGSSSTNQNGAVSGGQVASATIGQGGDGGNGGNSGTGAGSTGSNAASTPSFAVGGFGGIGGTGGANGAAASGASGGNSQVNTDYSINIPSKDLLWATTLVGGGKGGNGGGGGRGDGTNNGGGGGGGGSGNAVLAIYARTINRDASNTAAGTIRCNGGNGGNGGPAAAGTAGGGGGGAGGGGGWIYLVYGLLTGSATTTGAITANGGTGGNGGNGQSTGKGGQGGYGGAAGRITLINVASDTVTEYASDVDTQGSTPSTPSNATGGSGTSGTTNSRDL